MLFPKPQRIKNRALLDSYHARRCIICGRQGCDPCHLISVGSGGPDKSWNVFAACRVHHSEQHTIGINKFAEKYWQFRNWLMANGWEYDESRNKWAHSELTAGS